MNPDSTNQRDDRERFADTLRQLRPARVKIDASAVFYRAGFNAGQTQQAGHRLRLTHLVAAGLVAVMVAAPAGYLAGQNSAQQMSTSPRVAAADEKVDAIAEHPSPSMPEVQLVQVDSVRTPSLLIPSKSRLIELWRGQVGIAREQRRSEHDVTSLAAFHASGDSRQHVGSQWPDFFVRNDAFLHRDPLPGNLAKGDSSAKIFAARDVRAMADSLEDFHSSRSPF